MTHSVSTVIQQIAALPPAEVLEATHAYFSRKFAIETARDLESWLAKAKEEAGESAPHIDRLVSLLVSDLDACEALCRGLLKVEASSGDVQMRGVAQSIEGAGKKQAVLDAQTVQYIAFLVVMAQVFALAITGGKKREESHRRTIKQPDGREISTFDETIEYMNLAGSMKELVGVLRDLAGRLGKPEKDKLAAGTPELSAKKKPLPEAPPAPKALPPKRTTQPKAKGSAKKPTSTKKR